MHDEFFKCDPLNDFDAGQDAQRSVAILGIFYVALTFLAYAILKVVAISHE